MTCCCEGCHNSSFLQTAAVANGNGATFDVLGYPAVSFQVYGTIAGGTDVAFEFLSGLSTWLPLPVTNASDGTVAASGIVSAAGTYIANTVGLQKVRARVLNYGGADSINVVATAVCEATGTGVGGSSGTISGSVAVTSLPNEGQQTMANSISVAIASDQTAVATKPLSAILEGGVTELIGINEQVDTVEYSEDIGVALGGTYSGEILNIVLISTEDGTGAIQRPQGRLLILDADPGVAVGATTLGAAAFPTILGAIAVATTDWTTTDTGGAVAWKAVAVAFHALATIYFVWFQESASSWNDAAGDDEQLEFNFWYRRDS